MRLEDITQNKSRDFYGKQERLWNDRAEQNWTTEKKSRGLGDTIAKLAKVAKIDRLVKSMSQAAGLDCGCEKRQETFNKMFPYEVKL